MGYAIIRIAKRSSRAAVRGMLRHALREDAVPNAAPGAPRPRPVAGDATSGAALARLGEALKAAPRVRKDTIQALDILVTASHADMSSWPLDKQNDYFKRALAFIADRCGGRENILTAVVHRDETTPHMQVLVMPRDPETGRFQGVKLIGGPAGLRTLQDEFHEEVGKPHGLQRGEKGSKAEHVPIRRFYAQLATADAPLPDFVEVPPPPTWPQKLSGDAAVIEERRAKARAHNERVRKALMERARAAAKIHPSQLARAAHTYRQAVSMERLAKQEQEAAKAVSAKARAEFDQVRQATESLKATKTALEAQIDRGWHLGTVDAFSATVEPGYRAYLASALGIELKPGKLVDQVRRGLGLRTGADAVQAIERAAQARGASFLEAAGAWAARQEYDQDGGPSEGR